MSFSEKHRFLAGAVCPSCGALDKIVVYNVEGKDYRECKVCAFKEEMHFAPLVSELDTRVTHHEQYEKGETQVLQFKN
ncbi:MAG: YheV family putative metal-binding protein [Exilibacterium sp.]